MAYDNRLSKEDNEHFDEEAHLLRQVQQKGWVTRISTYLKLSGPGWLQSATTLAAGSLSGSLYLGVLSGFSMLWLQPVAMLLGIIMLGALGYITIATNQRPFHAINEHINPVLGWGWALGAMLASIVWALPQFALANGVVQQNLLPGYLGPDTPLGSFGSTLVVSVLILALSLGVMWNYGRGSRGVRIYEMLLKCVVGLIVLSFLGVVIRLAFISDQIAWGKVFAGFIPNPALIFRPADGFMPMLAKLPEISANYWSNIIVARQQQVMAAALSSAVGINMTFLFAYSMLRRKWGIEYRGLMQFDLATGMFFPFMLATSCIIIASASQFYTVPQPGFSNQQEIKWESSQKQRKEYHQLLKGRVSHEIGDNTKLSQKQVVTHIKKLSDGDRRMAAMLITRDAFDLATSLKPLLGGIFSGVIFGIGVLGMALSSITLMMIISGFVLCEMMNVSYDSWIFRAGALIPSVGVLGTFFWNQALFWLAIPTSVITLMLLPIAYVTFLLMINTKAIMGDHMPRGGKRVAWNGLIVAAIFIMGSASIYMLWQYAGRWGIAAWGVFLLAIAGTEWYRRWN